VSLFETKAGSINISIIGLIAIIAVIHDCVSFPVVPDDDLIEESIEEPCDEPSGTRTTPTLDVSPSHAPPPPAPPLQQRQGMVIPCLLIGFGTMHLVPQL
jgi:hypothetical protein